MDIENAEIVRSVRRVTFAGMAINVALAAAKAVGGILFSSQALLADAIHSVSDLVTDFAVVLGVRYWVAPADAEHPYGHGKIEALVTVFIALALAVVAWELGAHAVGSLCGGTLRVTSANLSGRRPATDAPQALADVGLSADLVIDDGMSRGGIPSTVVKVLPDGTMQTLRP